MSNARPGPKTPGRACLRTAGDPPRWRELRDRLSLTATEPGDWAAQAGRIYLPPADPNLVVERVSRLFHPSTPRVRQAAGYPDAGGHPARPIFPGSFKGQLGLLRAPDRSRLLAQPLHPRPRGPITRPVRPSGGILPPRPPQRSRRRPGQRRGRTAPSQSPYWRAISCSVCCRGNRFRFAVTLDSVTVKPVGGPNSPFPLRVNGRACALTRVGLRVPLAGDESAPGHEVKAGSWAKRGWKSNDDGWPDPGGGCRRR